MKKTIRLLGYALYFCVLLFADRLTKHLAVLALYEQPDVVLLPGVLQLHYLENTGAAFSIFRGQMWLFYIITPLLLGVLVYLFWRLEDHKKGRILKFLLLTVMTGAVGNYIDRLLYHYVIDFIYVSCIHFPVFNLADIYVTVSGFFLIVMILFFCSEEELKHMLRPKKGDTDE